MQVPDAQSNRNKLPEFDFCTAEKGPNLSLVPTDGLIEELSSRYDHFVLVGFREKEFPDGGDGIRRRFNGNHHMCMGLCADLIQRISQNNTKNEIPVDEDGNEIPEEERENG